MKLTIDQIRTVTFGALSVCQDKDAIRFIRFTEKQRESFSAVNPILTERSFSTAGIRLDFITDSSQLEFSVFSGSKFEIYLDGLFYRQIHTQPESAVNIPLCSPIRPAETVRVTLIFPNQSDGALRYVALDDGAKLIPQTFSRKILFMGDSITQGWNTQQDSLSWVWRVSLFYNAESINQGLGGCIYCESFFDTFGFQPDTVFVALGTNDFDYYKTKQDLQTQMSAYLDRVKQAYPRAQIHVISPIWRDTEDKPIGAFPEVRQLIIDEISRKKLHHIDGFSLVPHREEFTQDNTLHPNDLGHLLYAQSLLAQLDSGRGRY